MKYLVTGGAGFIGSAVCRHLINSTKAKVVNIDKLTYAANLRSLDSISGSGRYSFHKADICDLAAISAIMAAEEPDAVLHLAAESHVDRSITGSAAFVATNVVGTHVMLEAARSHWEGLTGARRDEFRFLHVSTDEVFGSLGEKGLFSEDTPYDPSSPYSASKAASDHFVRAWARTYGLPTLISNCSNNYGPCQFPEKLLPLMIINGSLGLELPVYGKGDNVRDWLYVEDHARALLAIVETGRPGEVYTVGGNCERSNLQVVQSICDHLDALCPRSGGASHRDLIAFVDDRPGHDFRYAIDASKIESELGWRPAEDFDSGLAKTVRWYLDNKDWWQPLREAVYGGERLGLTAGK